MIFLINMIYFTLFKKSMYDCIVFGEEKGHIIKMTPLLDNYSDNCKYFLQPFLSHSFS